MAEDRVAPRYVRITLKYDGADVNDGTMPIQDVVAALQGFSSAYARIANRYDPNEQHQIRVSAINQSSFAVLILAWATEHPQALLKGAASAVQWIISGIVKVVELKKSLKGQPPLSVTVNGNNNTVVVTNAGNVQTEMPPEIYQIFQDKLLDSDLNKITSPLEEGKVEHAVISATDPDGKEFQSISIDSSERTYFRSDEVTIQPRIIKGT